MRTERGFDGNVPDPENYLYCDPMDIMDIAHGETPNDNDDDDNNEYFLFQYNFLRQYCKLYARPYDTLRQE
jgi:hypothetical protein